MSGRWVTSALTASASRPRARISAAVASARSIWISAMTSLAPSRARASAIARPIPCAPPVTIATWFSSLMFSYRSTTIEGNWPTGSRPPLSEALKPQSEFESVHHLREDQRQEDIDKRRGCEKLEWPKVEIRLDKRRPHEFRHADDGDERRILQHPDVHVGGRRDDDTERLREDHVPVSLAPCHAD